MLSMLADRARECGWIVALYGSAIIDGDGRDLDLICVPWRPEAHPLEVSLLLSRLFGAVEVDRRESAWDQSLGVAYSVNGRIIDVLFVTRVPV